MGDRLDEKLRAREGSAAEILRDAKAQALRKARHERPAQGSKLASLNRPEGGTRSQGPLASLVNPTRPQTAAVLSGSRKLGGLSSSLEKVPLSSPPATRAGSASKKDPETDHDDQKERARQLSARRRRPESAFAKKDMTSTELLQDSELPDGEEARPVSGEPGNELWQEVKTVLVRVRDAPSHTKAENEAGKSPEEPPRPPEQDSSQLVTDLDTLNDLVRRPSQDGTEWSEKQRAIILKQVFKLVDGAPASVLARVATCAAAVAPLGSGSVLNVAKVAYKITKSEENDFLARESGLLAVLCNLMRKTLDHDPASSRNIECATFAFGALKNATNIDADNQDEVATMDAVDTCAAWITAASQDLPNSTTPAVITHEQLLSQILVLLRNLAVSDKHRKFFTKPGTCRVLARLLQNPNARAIENLMLSASRILAKLTLFQECRVELLENNQTITSMYDAMLRDQDKPERLPVLVRMAFVLGNLTGASLGARELLVGIPGALEKILDTIEDLAGRSSTDRNASEVNEALVKLVRLVANCAIGESVGPVVAGKEKLSVMMRILTEKSFDQYEELVLNVIGCITNISFYTESSEQSSAEWNYVIRDDLGYTKLLVPYLESINEEVVIETVRAFGNFSRSQEVRQHLNETDATHTLVMLLHHSNSEVVYNVCGVLMNLMAESEYKSVLAGDGVARLLELIDEAVTRTDWPLCTIVLKTLHNYCMEPDTAKASAIPDALPQIQLEMAMSQLAAVLEVPGSDDEDAEAETAREISEQLLGQLREAHPNVDA